MKHIFNTFLILLAIGTMSINLSAQVGINSTGSNADASAMLDVKSTTKGVLIPRMTSTQRTTISSPATGLLVYDTSTDSFWFHDGGWNELGAGGGLWEQNSSGHTYHAGLGSVMVGTSTSNGGAQLYAESTLLDGIKGVTTGLLKSGVKGFSRDYVGMHAESKEHYGILAISENSIGVYARSDNSTALYATGYSVGLRTVLTHSLGYGAYCDGDIYTTGVYQSSDRMLKQNEAEVSNALDIISQLRPKTYTYRRAKYRSMSLPEGKRYGFIAQEMETVLPQLVKNNKSELYDIDKYLNEIKAAKATGETANVQLEVLKPIEFKAVNYTEIIPILVGAMQEQQAQIEALKTEVQALKND